MNKWVRDYTNCFYGQADKKKICKKNFEISMKDAYGLAELKMLEVVEATIFKYQDTDMTLEEFRANLHELMAEKLQVLKTNGNYKAIINASLNKVIELTTAKDKENVQSEK